MHDVEKDTHERAQSGSGFHDGIWLALRMRSDESIVGTPSGVIKAKTVRRFPQDQRWCADEVLNMRGVPSSPMLGAGDQILIEANVARHAEAKEEENMPVQERESGHQSAHQSKRCHRGDPGCTGIGTGRSMPHNNEGGTRIKTRMEQSDDGREGLKREQQRLDRHLEKAVVRSVEEDPAL